jgi:hypothetical protein
MIRRKRLVRVHFKHGVSDASVEGVLLPGWIRLTRGDHYVLANARHLEDSDKSFNLNGEAWVPAATVLYLQPVGGGA